MNSNHAQPDSTYAWYMCNNGGRFGHGEDNSGAHEPTSPGAMKSGDILSLEADLDVGTLRFWVNGKPHGCGFKNGVTGKLKWAIGAGYRKSSAQIVPTPDLELRNA